MAGEWTEVRIEQIATKIAMGPFGSDIKTDNFVPTGVPVIRGGNLTSGRFHGADFVFVSEDKARQLASANAFPGDLVFTHRGTLGQVGLVPAKPFDRYVVSQSQMLLRCDPKAADSAFIYYFFKSDVGQHALLMNTSQTGVPAISRPTTSLKGIRLALPSLAEQRAIAHILGTLDDKIELNWRMSATLEAMARALFKSWFVDFDPVRAQAEGRDPGLPKPLADLFPARLVDSELGEIPEGWEVGPVESLCESITSGGTPTRMNPLFWKEGNIPWFKTGELLDGPLIESEEHITQAALDGSSCKLWPAGTILFALYASPTVGRLGVLTRPGTSNQAAAGLIAKPTIGVPFLRGLLLDARVKLQTIAVGAAQQNISQAVLKAHRAVVPTEKVASEYSRLVSGADERQVALSKEAKALAALRDTLLPKLISGELRIRDAERFLEGAPC